MAPLIAEIVMFFMNNMTTNSKFLGGYGLTGGYCSQLIP
jgi:hypothetical protein